MRQNINFDEAPFCAVGKSMLCDGQGLFTLKDIDETTAVVDYNESCQTWKICKFDEIPEEFASSCWWVGIDNEHCALASPESLFMRANHSKNPNLEWLPETKILKATRKICAGEELTYDYTKEIAPLSIKQNPPDWAK
jgi:hypothetical protein